MTTDTITDTITEAVDGAVDTVIDALPEDTQATARELVKTGQAGLSGAWDGVVNVHGGIADRLEPALGETVSNLASAAIMGIGGLLSLRLGSTLTGGLTEMFTGASSGLVNGIGGVALTVGVGMLAFNYLNGTGPFAPQQQVAATPVNQANTL